MSARKTQSDGEFLELQMRSISGSDRHFAMDTTVTIEMDTAVTIEWFSFTIGFFGGSSITLTIIIVIYCCESECPTRICLLRVLNTLHFSFHFTFPACLQSLVFCCKKDSVYVTNQRTQTPWEAQEQDQHQVNNRLRAPPFCPRCQRRSRRHPRPVQIMGEQFQQPLASKSCSLLFQIASFVHYWFVISDSIVEVD